LFVISNKMEKDIIKKIIIENQQRIPGLPVLKRDYSAEPSANYIITGQRRAGKTWFIFSILQDMIAAGLPSEAVLHINFEDERLIGTGVNDLETIMESYFELFTHTPVIFLDEIQNIEGWQKFARRLADQGYRVYITGSNSQMLSGEMASTLGGRFLVKEIGTLTFSEYLRFNELKVEDNIAYSQQRFEVIRLFGQYLTFGGFPEITKFTDKKEYLSSLFQKVFLGDIIARNQVRNANALRILVKKLAESTMDEVSYNRMRNIISSTGLQVATTTVIEYVKMLEYSYLISPLENYNAKITERESKKKYYFSDTGLLALFLIDPPSFQLETLVFNSLKRKHGADLHYFRNGYETDFIVPGKLIVQACYSIQDAATRSRELTAIIKTGNKFETAEKLIVTFDTEEIIQEGNEEIKAIPAWKWLMNNF